jgi:hypothetical protein
MTCAVRDTVLWAASTPRPGSAPSHPCPYPKAWGYPNPYLPGTARDDSAAAGGPGRASVPVPAALRRNCRRRCTRARAGNSSMRHREKMKHRGRPPTHNFATSINAAGPLYASAHLVAFMEVVPPVAMVLATRAEVSAGVAAKRRPNPSALFQSDTFPSSLAAVPQPATHAGGRHRHTEYRLQPGAVRT